MSTPILLSQNIFFSTPLIMLRNEQSLPKSHDDGNGLMPHLWGRARLAPSSLHKIYIPLMFLFIKVNKLLCLCVFPDPTSDSMTTFMMSVLKKIYQRNKYSNGKVQVWMRWVVCYQWPLKPCPSIGWQLQLTSWYKPTLTLIAYFTVSCYSTSTSYHTDNTSRAIHVAH